MSIIDIQKANELIKDVKSIYYDYQKVLSYNAMLNFLIGERGVGKTYGLKKFLIKQFLKTGKQFAFIRRYKNELKKATDNDSFFKDIKKEFPNHEFKFKKGCFYIDDQVMGYAMRLTEAQDLKGSVYDMVYYIMFDEFLIEKSRRVYLPDEVKMFLGVMESLTRMRDVKAFLLANATSSYNPYFAFFNVDMPYNSDIKLYKNGLILVQYMDNKAYKETKKQTRFGQLVAGTSYEDFAINNQFSDTTNSFIEKKSGSAKFSFCFTFNSIIYGVWFDYYKGRIYVSNDYDSNTAYNFSLTLDDHSENTMFLKQAKKYNCWKQFVDNYNLGNVRFENKKLKQITSEVIQKILK